MRWLHHNYAVSNSSFLSCRKFNNPSDVSDIELLRSTFNKNVHQRIQTHKNLAKRKAELRNEARSLAAKGDQKAVELLAKEKEQAKERMRKYRTNTKARQLVVANGAVEIII